MEGNTTKRRGETMLVVIKICIADRLKLWTFFSTFIAIKFYN